MRGYFGTELQQRLQRRADELASTVVNTPGLCNAGRMVSTDDVDRVGLEACIAMLEADGGFGFRLVHEDRTAAMSAHLAAREHRLDWWDTFMGSADDVLAASKRIVTQGPPQGLSHIDLSGNPSEACLERVQVFFVENGLAPFSRSTLAGETVNGRTLALVDEHGDLVATSFVYMPHNTFSPFRTYAWGGLAGPQGQVAWQLHQCLRRRHGIRATRGDRLLRTGRRNQYSIETDGRSVWADPASISKERARFDRGGKVHAVTVFGLSRIGKVAISITQGCHLSTPSRGQRCRRHGGASV